MSELVILCNEGISYSYQLQLAFFRLVIIYWLHATLDWDQITNSLSGVTDNICLYVVVVAVVIVGYR